MMRYFIKYSELVRELRHQLETQPSADPNNGLLERIKFQDNIKVNPESKVSSRGGYAGIPKKNILFLGAYPIQGSVQRLIARAQELSLPRALKVKTISEWDPDSFMGARKLGLPFLRTIVVEKKRTSIDPTRTRMEDNAYQSSVRIETNLGRTQITGAGNYKQLLPDFAAHFSHKCKIEITLTPEDAERLERNLPRTPLYVRGAWFFVKTSDAKPREVFGLQIGPDSEPGTKVLRGPASALPLLEKIIQKSICGSKNGSQVEFYNQHLATEFFGNRYLESVQYAVDVLRQDNNAYGFPLISDEEALRHLRRELVELQGGFRTFEAHRGSADIFKWSAEIEKLVAAIGGEELIQLFHNYENRPQTGIFSDEPVNEREFAEILRRFGYQPREIPDIPNAYRVRFQGDGSMFISRKTAREAHLVHLISQTLVRNPGALVKDYKSSYVETPPALTIRMAQDYKGSKVGAIKSPDHARIAGLKIEHRNPHEFDDLAFGMSRLYDDVPKVSFHTQLANPVMLGLQEEAFELAGGKID